MKISNLKVDHEHRDEAVLMQVDTSTINLCTRHDRIERKIMQEHVDYWKDLSDRRIAIIFGPVLDPKDTWGVAIVEVASEPEAHILGRNDPAVQADFTFELFKSI